MFPLSSFSLVKNFHLFIRAVFDYLFSGLMTHTQSLKAFHFHTPFCFPSRELDAAGPNYRLHNGCSQFHGETRDRLQSVLPPCFMATRPETG